MVHLLQGKTDNWMVEDTPKFLKHKPEWKRGKILNEREPLRPCEHGELWKAEYITDFEHLLPKDFSKESQDIIKK